MVKVPSIRFSVNKYVNLYYHVCVLFSEYLSDECANGILNNAAYKKQYEHLKTQRIHQKFQKLWRHSYYAWDFVGKSIFEAKTNAFARKILNGASQDQADTWMEILSEGLPSYEDIWSQTEGRIKEYIAKFEAEWNPIHHSTLSKMSEIAKLPWKIESITVHFVDCVHGASSWSEDIVMPPFPDMDVEKKLLSHEVAHILAPDYLLKTKLQGLGLECAIAHTIVDLIAYFGVKEHVTDPERRGIKPNPTYYKELPRLYLLFEDCSKNPDRYQSFDEILNQARL